MKRHYFVSYYYTLGKGRVFADAIVTTHVDKGVLSRLRNFLTEDSGGGEHLVILNYKELSEEEFEILKD